MAVNIQQELERLYKQNQTQSTSLSERLNQMDEYTRQVDPMVRGQMVDFSDRPAGYNPLNDIASAINFSENSRTQRAAASQDVERTQSAGLNLLQQLDALQQRKGGTPKLTPEEQMMLDVKKAALLEQVKKGTLRFKEDGSLEVSTEPAISETTQDIIGVIDQLTNKNTKPITGALQLESMIPGTSAKQTEALYDQLKGMLSLENRQQLKGSGAISDFEFKVLSQASSALNRNLSDDDFRKTLKDLRDKLTNQKGKIDTSGQKQQKKDPLNLGI